jgi:hypothetical protein
VVAGGGLAGSDLGWASTAAGAGLAGCDPGAASIQPRVLLAGSFGLVGTTGACAQAGAASARTTANANPYSTRFIVATFGFDRATSKNEFAAIMARFGGIFNHSDATEVFRGSIEAGAGPKGATDIDADPDPGQPELTAAKAAGDAAALRCAGKGCMILSCSPTADTGAPFMSDDYSSDSVTEVTTTGWLQRIGQSIVGALIGILLVIGSIILLWWNEGRAVEAIRALERGAKQLVEAQANAVDPAKEGKLIHLSGMMEAKAPARDTNFGVGADNLLRLRRTVEMFQWVEHKESHSHKNLGGSETTETTYTYRKEWTDHALDSSHFHEPGGHGNPPMPIRSATIDSQDARLGAYHVDRAVLDAVSAFTEFDPGQATSLPSGYRKTGDMLYRGEDPAAPAIGDIRIHYTAVAAQTVSVVAAQANGTLAPFSDAIGYKIGLAEAGVVPANVMFKEKAHEESVMTWILRVVGFVLMLIGFWLMGSPLGVVLGVIPLFEALAEAGAFLMALIVSVPLTLTVIAAAWIAHRPLIGVGLIVAALVLGYLLRRLHRRPAPPTSFLPAGTLR